MTPNAKRQTPNAKRQTLNVERQTVQVWGLTENSAGIHPVADKISQDLRAMQASFLVHGGKNARRKD
jgi:hypothetical protein